MDKRAAVRDDCIILQFTGGKEFFYETLKWVKEELPGRKFHPGSKLWFVPKTDSNIKKLKDDGWNMKYKCKSGRSPIQEKKEYHINEKLQKNLFAYQKEGVIQLLNREGKLLIADEMGLGKTIQSVAFLQIKKDNNEEIKNTLIVCPASLKLNWKREILEWTDYKKSDIQVVSSKKDKIEMKKITICNYDILFDNFIDEKDKKLKPKNVFDCVVWDECHFVKNQKAKRTKAVVTLAKSAQYKIALSGTPVMNNPQEIWNTISVIDPETWNNKWSFLYRYTNPITNRYGTMFKGAKNTDELHARLNATVMIRRKKEDVLKDLPKKRRSIQIMEENQHARSEYNEAEENIIQYILKKDGVEKAGRAKNAEILSKINRLKQLSWEMKKKAAIQWIKDYLETSNKIVVFAHHKKTIDAIMSEFGDKAVKVDGSVKNEDRQKAVDAFQNNDKKKVFVGNIKAAGVGLTLTAAHSVVFVEFSWTPADHDQAEDRVHRIGQTADSVMAYYLICDSSIDNKLMSLLDEKRSISDAVIDGVETEESSMLAELLKRYRKNYR